MSSTITTPPAGYPASKAPTRYGAGKLSTLRSRWGGALGEQLRAHAPQLWPGVPVSAFLGFTSIGSRDEDTAPTANRVFHEVGYFQTPAGPADGPAPAANPDAPYNAWGKLARDPIAAELLGRAPRTAPGSWRGADAVPDQVVIGLLDLHRELTGFRAAVRSAGAGVLAPLELASVYTVACSFSAFSAGATGAARNLARVGSSGWRDAGATEATAWDWIVDRVAQLWQRGQIALSPSGAHSNAAYTILRTTQKLAAGAQLARALGLTDELAWYPRVALGEMPGAEIGLTSAAFGVRP